MMGSAQWPAKPQPEIPCKGRGYTGNACTDEGRLKKGEYMDLYQTYLDSLKYFQDLLDGLMAEGPEELGYFLWKDNISYCEARIISLNEKIEILNQKRIEGKIEALKRKYK